MSKKLFLISYKYSVHVERQEIVVAGNETNGGMEQDFFVSHVNYTMHSVTNTMSSAKGKVFFILLRLLLHYPGYWNGILNNVFTNQDNRSKWFYSLYSKC